MPTLRVSPVQTDNADFDRALSSYLTGQGFERVGAGPDWSRSFDAHAEADGAAESIEAEIEDLAEKYPTETKVEIFVG
jgi:hypothetical protein